MNRKKNMLISAAAAVMSGMLVYGVYTVQLRQIRFQETLPVVVPKRFVDAGERLTADVLTVKQISKASYEPDMVLDPEEAAGQEAVVPLGSGEPLLDWKIDKYRLLPDRSQSTFQIPREYVKSISNGIRAGDKVLLYVTGQSTASARLFDEPVTVASVKSSANIEIDDPANPNLLSLAEGDKEKMYASRRDANGMIDFVNLNLTEAQWLKLDNLCRDGKIQLVVAFSPESMDVGDTASGEGAGP
ncbi:SAF domain-containing protein [Paenibacillus humicola]|uniref:SAF domain-containing protein n=1 Tax=Paenibacillus humicola TaxID=3110540 RepID=UPI00237C19BC|nr:SAF domain-containing protein [Paenibacillus humicola]